MYRRYLLWASLYLPYLAKSKIQTLTSTWSHMAPQNCCCLSSGNPWQVTKQDIFHSLINYLEENWKTASFWKDQGLRTVWDTKLILPPNIAKSSPPPPLLLSSVSWSILPTESGFWNAYLLWYHFLYLLYGSMRKVCSVKVASLWNMPAKSKCAESKTPLCLYMFIDRTFRSKKCALTRIYFSFFHHSPG